MALLDLTAFAERCTMPRRMLMVYVKRGKVVVDGEYVETTHPTNVAFYNHWVAKATGEKPVKEKPPKVAPPKGSPVARQKAKPVALPDSDDEADDEDVEDLTPGAIMSLSRADKVYQHYRAMRNQKAAEKAELELAKMRGDLIPIDAIIPLFQLQNDMMLKEVQSTMEAELRILAKKHGMSHEDVVAVKGRWTKELNLTVDRAKDATKKGIQSMVENIIADK